MLLDVTTTTFADWVLRADRPVVVLFTAQRRVHLVDGRVVRDGVQG